MAPGIDVLDGAAGSSESSHRPKGILKNPFSPSPSLAATPGQVPDEDAMPLDSQAPRRPSLPHTASEKEIVAANTRANAGARRNSSNPRSGPSSRRQSASIEADHNASVKFDEVELFQHDQQRGNKMPIDEPKTPFVHGTASTGLEEEDDPSPDEAVNGEDLLVDELDQRKARPSARRVKSIPDLDLGEPEDSVSRTSSTEKRVVVGENGTEESLTGHGEKSEDEMTNAERTKHKRFEDLRKQHYKIPQGLLAHADDEMDE